MLELVFSSGAAQRTLERPSLGTHESNRAASTTVAQRKYIANAYQVGQVLLDLVLARLVERCDQRAARQWHGAGLYHANQSLLGVSVLQLLFGRVRLFFAHISSWNRPAIKWYHTFGVFVKHILKQFSYQRRSKIVYSFVSI
jgi:hypothetical protein